MGLDQYLFRQKGNQQKEEIGYWRKFNALQAYIANEIAHKPNMNCEPVTLTEDHINDILDRCRAVKSIMAKGTKTVTGEGEYWDTKEKYQIYSYDKKTCEEISKIFAPQSGFFWGGTEIDNYFERGIDSTIKKFEDALESLHAGYTITYDCWW